MSYSRITQAVILVGGKGTRLGELSKSTPKPLMPLYNNFTFLDFLIREISHQGFSKILLLSGYLSEQFIEKYDGKELYGAQINVIVENEPLGTAGALKNAGKHLNSRFMMTNGDSYLQTSYRAGEALLQNFPDSLGALILRSIKDNSRYGNVCIKNHFVKEFKEKSSVSNEADKEGLINAGIYFMNKNILESIPNGYSSLEKDIFPKLAEDNLLVATQRDGYFIDIGLKESLTKARTDLPQLTRRPALFLDRDGVINIDHGYVCDYKNFDWIDGAIEVIKHFNENGWYAIVVTNQAGIGKGYYSVDQMHELHQNIQDQLALYGAYINEFYYCPYHADAKLVEYKHVNHPNRKPNPGMLLQAMNEWPIDLEKSILIGDKETDIKAAKTIGIKSCLFKGHNLMSFLRNSTNYLPQET